MGDKKKARAYVIDGTNGTRYGPERDASDKANLERDKKLLEHNAMSDFTSSGIREESDSNYQSEKVIPTDSAYAVQEKRDREETEKQEREIYEQEQARVKKQIEKEEKERARKEAARKKAAKKKAAKKKKEKEKKRKKKAKEKREKEKWKDAHERVIKEQGGSNARDHDVDRGRSEGVA